MPRPRTTTTATSRRPPASSTDADVAHDAQPTRPDHQAAHRPNNHLCTVHIKKILACLIEFQPAIGFDPVQMRRGTVSDRPPATLIARAAAARKCRWRHRREPDRMHPILIWLAVWLLAWVCYRVTRWRRADRHRLRRAGSWTDCNDTDDTDPTASASCRMTPFMISYTTTAGCESLYRLGQLHAVVWRRWFRGGLLLAAIGVPLATAGLAYQLIRALAWIAHAAVDASNEQALSAVSFDSASSSPSGAAVATSFSRNSIGSSAVVRFGSPSTASSLQLSIPGITVPWSKCAFLLLALVVSMAWHELGHALCAASWRVRTVRIGLVLAAAGFMPAAYVELQDDSNEEAAPEFDEEVGRLLPSSRSTSVSFPSLPPLQQLYITAAGIWHNFVLCMVCLVAIALLPCILAPFYANTTGSGVVVSHIDAIRSPALAAVMSPGYTRITHIDGVLMTDMSAFKHITDQTQLPAARTGHCIDADLVRWAARDTAAAESAIVGAVSSHNRTLAHASSLDALCCLDEAVPGVSTQCFQFVDHGFSTFAHACLHTRPVFEAAGTSATTCDADVSDSCTPGMNGAPRVCVAMRASEFAVEEERLWPIRVVDHSRSSSSCDAHPLDADAECSDLLLFVGTDFEIASSLTVDVYMPRTYWSWLLPVGRWSSLASRLPRAFDECIRWIFAISASLALLNCAPMYGTDGAHIVRQAWELRQSSSRRSHSARDWPRIILLVGSALFAANLLLAIWATLDTASRG